ncbi:hypothetical protein WS99_27345 [Burkholderia territorii]|nr:hypothetical protein WS99_27345 [Burkholderia territorii]
MSFSEIRIFAGNQKHMVPKVLSAFVFRPGMTSEAFRNTFSLSDIRNLLLPVRFVSEKNVQTSAAGLRSFQKISEA